MPPPVSFIDITSVPFSQLVTQAVFNVSNEVWFRYIAAAPIVLGTQTNAGGTFKAITTYYESDGSTIVKGPFSNSSGAFGNWAALLTANTYYIKVTRVGGGASDFDFTFTANTSPLDNYSPNDGDIIVNDDQNLAATVYDSSLNLLGYLSNIPGGEMGAMLPGSFSVWHDFYGVFHSTNKIAIFDDTMTYVTSVQCGVTGSNLPKFGIDIANDQIYVVDQTDELWVIDNTFTATDTGYFWPGDSPEAIAVSPDGTKIYWATRTNNANIHVLNVPAFTNGTDLYTIPGFTTSSDTICRTPNVLPGDMFCLPDGTVVFSWYDSSLLEDHIVAVTALGALTHSETYSDPVRVNHLAYIDADSAHIMVWLYTTAFFDTVRFGRYNISTGVIDNDVSFQAFEDGQNMLGTDKFGPSTSCTFLRIAGVTPPPTFGTITVMKTTLPGGLTQTFSFTAGGGLSPSSFDLIGDGDSQVFLSVPTGSGYSIVETPDDRYSTEYTVSNDPSNNNENITVDEDENVVVTVTNTLISSIGSGIYKIVPGANKRNDTLWNANTSGTTDVKIPNPFGTSGMIGS